MKKIIPLLLVILLLSVQPALAEPVEIEVVVDPVNQSVEQGMHAFYNITVTNRMDNGDNFLVKFSGPYLEWRWPTKMELSLDTQENGTVTAEFVPQKPGEFAYYVEAVSGINPNVRNGTTFYLTSIKPPYVRVKDLTATVGEKTLDTSLIIEVVKKTTLDIQYVIRDSENRILKTGTVSKEITPIFVGVPVTVEKSLPLDGIMAGTHTVEVVVGGDILVSRDFTVKVVHAIEERDEESSGFGYDEMVITVTNHGNSIEKDLKIEREIPKGDFVTAFITEPSNCVDGETSQTCTFVVGEIQPGSSASVTYRIEHWPSYSKIIAAVLILIFGGLYYLVRITRPKIIKRVHRKSTDVHHITIDVRAPKLKGLQNVIVRDWVSPLAEVLHEEFSYAAPVTKRTDAGTELIWQLGNMAKKEERILSYKIKTLVRGSLKMPRAYLRFRDKKGGRERIYTRGIVVR